MSRRLRMTSVCLLGATLAACSASKGAYWDGASDTGFADTGDDMETGDSPDDGLEPQLWRLSAAVSIHEGALLPEESSLAITLVAADESTLCEETVALESLEAEAESPDPAIYAWWRLEPADLQGACASWPSPLPERLLLGVGALGAELRAQLEPAGLTGLAESLNGAYASLDEGATIYVFGVAGTAPAYAGEVGAVVDAALGDGVWIVRPIYPFAY